MLGKLLRFGGDVARNQVAKEMHDVLRGCHSRWAGRTAGSSKEFQQVTMRFLQTFGVSCNVRLQDGDIRFYCAEAFPGAAFNNPALFGCHEEIIN